MLPGVPNLGVVGRMLLRMVTLQVFELGSLQKGVSKIEGPDTDPKRVGLLF